MSEERKADMEAALVALVRRIDEIANDSDFKTMQTLYHTHGFRYRGPSWAEPLKDAHNVLSSGGLPMSEQRKADMEAALAELRFEIDLAISQGAMDTKFQWMATFEGPPEAQGEVSQPWFAVLTIGKV